MVLFCILKVNTIINSLLKCKITKLLIEDVPTLIKIKSVCKNLSCVQSAT